MARDDKTSGYAPAMVAGGLIFAAGLATGRYACQPATPPTQVDTPVVLRADPPQRDIPPAPTVAPVTPVVTPPAPIAPPPPAPELEDPFEGVESVPDEAPQSSEDRGMLVAIAIGGQCTFYVDGTKQGTKSSIRIEVAVGRHTVRCETPPGERRPSGSPQTIEVTLGKPGIASFRIH